MINHSSKCGRNPAAVPYLAEFSSKLRVIYLSPQFKQWEHLANMAFFPGSAEWARLWYDLSSTYTGIMGESETKNDFWLFGSLNRCPAPRERILEPILTGETTMWFIRSIVASSSNFLWQSRMMEYYKKPDAFDCSKGWSYVNLKTEIHGLQLSTRSGKLVRPQQDNVRDLQI